MVGQPSLTFRNILADLPHANWAVCDGSCHSANQIPLTAIADSAMLADIMTLHFNKTAQKQRRRYLRNHLTRSEAILWKYLSRRQKLGFKFRRQYSVDQFVIDFYCPELKLAVEVDGEIHFIGKAPEYDRTRQSYIESFGIRFFRITNEDITTSLDGVLEQIAAKIEQLQQSVN